MCPPMWSESRTSMTATLEGKPLGEEVCGVEDEVAGVSEAEGEAWEARMRWARSSRDINVRSEMERVDILGVRWSLSLCEAGWKNE